MLVLGHHRQREQQLVFDQRRAGRSRGGSASTSSSASASSAAASSSSATKRSRASTSSRTSTGCRQRWHSRGTRPALAAAARSRLAARRRARLLRNAHATSTPLVGRVDGAGFGQPRRSSPAAIGPPARAASAAAAATSTMQRIVLAAFHAASLCRRVQRRQSAHGARHALILASTSRYRRELLQRLRLPFEIRAPGVDETALPGEAPARRWRCAWRWPRREQSRRCARRRGHRLATRWPNSTARHRQAAHARARRRATARDERTRVVFHTAVAVVRTRRRLRARAAGAGDRAFRATCDRRDRALPAAGHSPTTVPAAPSASRSAWRCSSRSTPTTRRR